MNRLLIMSSSLLLGACAVGPDYLPPETMASPFTQAAPAGLVETTFEAAWWEQFGDPALDDLIERALEGDLDLKVAAARVTEARALLNAQRRARWPGAAAEIGYDNRKAQVPDCIQLTPWNIDALQWMPMSCAYRRIHEGRGLAWWHPLVSGDPETVHEAGVSIRGQTISEAVLREPEDALDFEVPGKMRHGGLLMEFSGEQTPMV